MRRVSTSLAAGLALALIAVASLSLGISAQNIGGSSRRAAHRRAAIGRAGEEATGGENVEAARR